MSLLIHATLQVSGDAAMLAALRERLNAALAEDYADLTYTETHRDDALHYDFKASGGIPFPALIAVSQEFAELSLALRWVNPEVGTQAAAEIKAGRIESQSTDLLDASGAGRQPGYVAALADGSLLLAFALFSMRDDGCAGYVISADKDGLFQIDVAGDKALLYLSEADLPQWDACLQFDLSRGEGSRLEKWTRPPMDEANYQKWREYALAFVSEWFWLEDDAPESTVVERQRGAEHGVPIKPANVRYQKLKAMRERGAPAAGLYEFDRLGESERYAQRILLKFA